MSSASPSSPSHHSPSCAGRPERLCRCSRLCRPVGGGDGDARLVADAVLSAPISGALPRGRRRPAHAGPQDRLRRGQKGPERQAVETRWNGRETTNTATRRRLDRDQSDAREKPLRDREGHLNVYVIAAEQFASLYEPTGGDRRARRHLPRQAAPSRRSGFPAASTSWRPGASARRAGRLPDLQRRGRCTATTPRRSRRPTRRCRADRRAAVPSLSSARTCHSGAGRRNPSCHLLQSSPFGGCRGPGLRRAGKPGMQTTDAGCRGRPRPQGGRSPGRSGADRSTRGAPPT